MFRGTQTDRKKISRKVGTNVMWMVKQGKARVTKEYLMSSVMMFVVWHWCSGFYDHTHSTSSIEEASLDGSQSQPVIEWHIFLTPSRRRYLLWRNHVSQISNSCTSHGGGEL
jgi:hypothetical protein